MKKLRVTLNNRVYEVLVEVLEDDDRGTAAPAIPAPAAPYPVMPPMAAPIPVPAPAPVMVQPAYNPAAAASGAGIFAPIVGTVTKILVAPGTAVKQNQPLIILDAMKMDTYINSPRDGTIASIDCKVDDSVQVGQKLVSFQ